MKVFLQEFLPRVAPAWRHGEHFLLVPHEGKSDLEESIRRKVKAWREPGTRFVIVRDNDNAECGALKQRLLGLCTGSRHEVIVRLVCQELEAWYLGDGSALQAAYPESTQAIRNLLRRHRDPDACNKPARELMRAIPQFQKQAAARRLGRLIDADTNRSASFRVFVAAVRHLALATTRSQV
ncbi:MAG: DUF4276 family protein [Myxococcota bacterium]|nr:DUF4276 family protein [Myxococcota bacterium]